MHWIKLFLESWLFLGITTTIVGIFWTTKESTKLNDRTTNATPPQLPDFTTEKLAEARSA